MMSDARSSTWRWSYQNCHRASWPCASTDEKQYFVLGGVGLSAAEGTYDPHHQPGLCGDQGGERVQGQDHSHQPALAGRTSLTSRSHRLGLVLISRLYFDDFSRYIVAWKLCATMCADDAIATLDLALSASGLNRVTVVHRPRLLSDNGSSYVAARFGQVARGQGHAVCAWGNRIIPAKSWKGKDRALASDPQEPHSAQQLLPASGDLERQIETFVEHYNQVRYHESIINNLTPGRRLLRQGRDYPRRA